MKKKELHHLTIFLLYIGPLSRVIKQNIILRNSSNQVLAFKVKTTSPQVYSVRPNVGFIEPLGTVQILGK